MQICKYADRCSRLLAIDACLLTKIVFLLSRQADRAYGMEISPRSFVIV
jgi:hypothetical protein